MDILELPTLHRMSTLSSIRKMASNYAAKKGELLTEAEAKFEEAVK